MTCPGILGLGAIAAPTRVGFRRTVLLLFLCCLQRGVLSARQQLLKVSFVTQGVFELICLLIEVRQRRILRCQTVSEDFSPDVAVKRIQESEPNGIFVWLLDQTIGMFPKIVQELLDRLRSLPGVVEQRSRLVVSMGR